MTSKLTSMSILTTVALIIFIIEAQVPLPIPVPGVKLGLANAVTLFALFYERKSDGFKLSTFNVFVILLCRILLGAFFTGRLVAFAYSLAGGVLALIAQIIVKRFVTKKQIWVCGAIGAIFHNIGQIAIAIVITGTASVVFYLPVLIIAGIVTGVLTGLVAQMTISRIKQ